MGQARPPARPGYCLPPPKLLIPRAILPLARPVLQHSLPRLALAAAARSARNHPWRWLAATFAVLIVFPGIDITISSWFFVPAHKVFVARVWGPSEWIRLSMPRYLLILAGGVALAWLAGEIKGRVFFGVTRRVGLFLLASLALGPGLLVNTILKDSWGRPRPSTILQFGGSDYYTAPFALSAQCDHNCSFPSGHAALAFWLVSFALLAPPAWRGRAVAAAVGFGAIVGLSRIAQGGHFLSDIVASGAITIAITVWLWRSIIGDKTSISSKNNPLPGGDSP